MRRFFPLVLASMLFAALSFAATQTKSNESFSYIVMSDPQLYWVCLPENTACTGGSEKEQGIDSNGAMVRGIKALHQRVGSSLQGVIINGDLTAYGHGHEFAAYQRYYRPEVLGIEIFPGLGNHDYANNVNTCVFNNCAVRMMYYMMDEIQRLNKAGKLRNYDYQSSGKDHSGSFAYSWDVGNWHFVQLHNHPSYTTEFEGTVWFRAGSFQVESAFSWLREDLAEATREGKKIILNFHDCGEHFSADDAEFKQILSDYPVRAVFAGHIHQHLGLVRNIRAGKREIPLYRSGSASLGAFLHVRFDDDDFEVEEVLARD